MSYQAPEWSGEEHIKFILHLMKVSLGAAVAEESPMILRITCKPTQQEAQT